MSSNLTYFKRFINNATCWRTELLLISSRTEPTGRAWGPGPLGLLSSRSKLTQLSMAQMFSAVSCLWFKAWKRSWRIRRRTWIPMMATFTGTSRRLSSGPTHWKSVRRKSSVGIAPRHCLHQKYPSLILRGSSGVTPCWRPLEFTSAGWSTKLGPLQSYGADELWCKNQKELNEIYLTNIFTVQLFYCLLKFLSLFPYSILACLQDIISFYE